jgi:DNA-binding PadR family transcriptional regulator
MALPPGEVDLHDVMGWAQEQSVFLRSPSMRLVLWYLCVNAFRHVNNPENREPGDVLSAYATVARIQRGTGLSDKSVREALQELQDEGYIVADLKHGRGKSRITVFWTEQADERRADFRDGIRDLPKGFQRTPKSTAPTLELVSQDAKILPFRSGKNYRNSR